MTKNKKETSVIIKPTYERYVSIDENIFRTLSSYSLMLYMEMRFQASYGQDDSEIKRSAQSLYTKARISRAQYFRSLNELEECGLILRDSTNEIGQPCKIHIARELGYFLNNNEDLGMGVQSLDGGVSHRDGGVSHRDGGVSHRDTYHKSFHKLNSLRNNINIITCDNGTKKVDKGVSDEQIVEAYHEVLPEMPKTKVVDQKLKSQLKQLRKNWPKYQKDGNEFSIESFKDYLNYVKQYYSWLTKPYRTASGNIKQSSLRTLTRETNIAKIVNGEYSES